MGRFVDDCTHSADPAQGALPYGSDTAVSSNAATGQVRRDNSRYVRLEIRTDTLYSLINTRSLVIEDLRHLDGQAKRYIRQFLLDTLRDR
jgi:hypothetical protein